ncbi:MAG: hypothetical protein JNM83_05255 [Myxococcales bacterium]|jgi:hypothetical protein|nr:hypothetical protein [Myxococcales bacterium]
MRAIATSIPGFDSAMAAVDDEPDPVRRMLLNGFLADSEGNEDLHLAALDRAEAGTPELNWGDHYVDIDMYPDGRVVIAKTEGLLEDDEQDNPPQITITIGEARKLILDWIDARDRWYAEREAQRAAAGQSK